MRQIMDRLKQNYIPLILICALTIPLSMSIWLFNVGYIHTQSYTDESTIIAPMRCLIACFLCIIIAAYGLKKKSLSISGAFLGLFVGIILTIGSYSFFACLFTFFATSSKATKFRENEKLKLEENHKKGGQRSWIHVLCNGGVAMQLGLLYLLDVGCGERPINFANDYRPSWLAMGILGSFACCNGDTWASELGTVLTFEEPFLITSRKKVPRGTNGGVTIVGIILSAIGGFIIGVANYIAIIYFCDKEILLISPVQWPIILIATIAGVFGSILDSVLGATLQYSGMDDTGKIVSLPGKNVKYISGRQILDNHSVNLISTLLTALVMPYVAMYLWPI